MNFFLNKYQSTLFEASCSVFYKKQADFIGKLIEKLSNSEIEYIFEKIFN